MTERGSFWVTREDVVGLTATELLVYLYCCERARFGEKAYCPEAKRDLEIGQFYIGKAELARRARVSKRTIYRVLLNLHLSGHLNVHLTNSKGTVGSVCDLWKISYGKNAEKNGVSTALSTSMSTSPHPKEQRNKETTQQQRDDSVQEEKVIKLLEWSWEQIEQEPKHLPPSIRTKTKKLVNNFGGYENLKSFVVDRVNQIREAPERIKNPAAYLSRILAAEAGL